MRLTSLPSLARAKLRGLGIALSLSLAFLGYTAWQLSEQFAALQQAHRVTRAVAAQDIWGTSLVGDVAWFVVAQLALHTCLGLLAWLLAVATQYAWPEAATRRGVLVCAWFAALGTCVMMANASLFPWSRTAGTFSFATLEILRTVSVYHLFVSSMLVSGAIVAVRAVLRARRERPLLARIAIWGAVTWAALGLYGVARSHAEPAHESLQRPHVIIIGIDSLRSDMVGRGGQLGATPELSGFLREAHVIPDTLSPLARTFPAWTSILTGRHPVRTGARDNLVPFERLHLGRTLAEILRSEGYRTAYATDEVRFSNIDRRYGFDQVIAPKAGASDFLLAGLNDLPLANLLSATRIAGWLFPNTYANRAASITYRPHTFVERLRPQLDFSRPTFFATHLTLPHWPYEWADSLADGPGHVNDNAYAYLAAIRAVDQQFGELIASLERAGALGNAVVVVLSDHGEGLGLPSDNLIFGKGAKQVVGPLAVGMWGHGNSVLSPHQFSVLLGFRGFGAQALPSATRQLGNVPASLEDIAPTVLDLLDVRAAGEEFDGVSLANVLRGGSSTMGGDRIRFTETGLSTGLMKAGRFDERSLADEAARQFSVHPRTGRLELRPEAQERIVASKERAAILGDLVLAVVPDDDSPTAHYLLVNRHGGLPQRLTAAPDPSTDADAARLWQALQRRFGAELRPPAQSGG